MKFGKMKAGAVAAGLSLAMALSPVAAFAAPMITPTNEGTKVTDGVTKTLQLNPGSTVDETFTFTATPVQLNATATDGTATEPTKHGTETFPAATINDIKIEGDGSSTAEDANTGKSDIIFGTFPHAGVYAWTIEETTPDTKTDGMQYSTEKYTLIATVSNADNAHSGLWVSDVKIVKGETTSTTNTEDEKTGDGKKVDSATFTNMYTENTSDDQNKSDLTITKTVTGAQGDKTKQFNFTVEFVIPDGTVLPLDKDGNVQSVEDVLKAITATSTNGAEIGKLKVDPDTNSAMITFKASDMQSVTFSNLLVGMKYDVLEDEAGDDGYTTTWSSVANGVKQDTKSLTSTASWTNANLIGERTNSGDMENEKDGSPVTGLIVNNAPFIVMIGVAAAGVAAYGTAKRKLEK